MLIAEIHGKRNTAIQNDEDCLTSAVFGHLRHVTDGRFWRALFERAHSITSERTNLATELRLHDLSFPAVCQCQIAFWPYYAGYGEPDLLVRFQSSSGRPVFIVIEVKLYSGKSGVGEEDQLARYYRLSQSGRMSFGVEGDNAFVSVVYLTERYAMDELEDSVAQAGDDHAARRMFAMQWQDLLQATTEFTEHDPLLEEVARFLRKRGLEAFQGMREVRLESLQETGGFYEAGYFSNMPELPNMAPGEPL